MKSFGILIGLTSTLLTVFAARTAEPPQLRVRVTSSDPSQQLLFTAAYVFNDPDSELERLDTVTPAEFARDAELFFGIFRQKSGDALLEVRVFTPVRGQWREVLMGDGNVVVMSERHGSRWASSW